MWIELTKDILGQKAGQRIEVEDKDGQALIAAGSAKPVPGDPLADVVGKAMQEMLGKLSSSLNGAVEDALKQFAAAQTLSQKGARKILFGEGSDGDPKRTFGSFLLAVRNRDQKALEAMGARYVDWTDGAEGKAALNTQVGTAGGYAVPIEFHERLLALVTERSIVRPRATIVPMTSRSVQVPSLDVVTAPTAGDTAFLGGLVARWTEEATTLNETEPNLKMVDLINYELSGYTKVSNTMLADNAIGLESFLLQLFARAIAWYEDWGFLRGDGVGKPLGVLNWAGLVAVTRSGASAFAVADAANMYSKLLPGFSPSSACWVMQPTVLAKALLLTQGPLNFFLDATGKPRFSLYGLPVEVTEKMPALNTAGDVLLCDFQHYLLGDRRQVEIAFSDQVAFLTNQAVWRFVSRIGGQPWLKTYVTLSDASTTVSPFISLAAG